MPSAKKTLMDGFRRLFKRFGPRYWWPGETAFEVMVGAILTQNTNWTNVKKAIANLEKVLEPHKLLSMPATKLSKLIRPAGYFRVKAKRLRNFLKYFVENYDGDARRMAKFPTAQVRHELLQVNGVGPETADSILLYALNKPVFVIDAYTRRILSRHKLCALDAGYDELQKLFMENLSPDVELFNEYHALIVECGKNYCRKKPKCDECPLNGW